MYCLSERTGGQQFLCKRTWWKMALHIHVHNTLYLVLSCVCFNAFSHYGLQMNRSQNISQRLQTVTQSVGALTFWFSKALRSFM